LDFSIRSGYERPCYGENTRVHHSGDGTLFPISALLTDLRNRGHDIALRTIAAGVEGDGRGMGFATAPVDPRIEGMPLDDAGAANPQQALSRERNTFARHAD
jgi:hypothetical protein